MPDPAALGVGSAPISSAPGLRPKRIRGPAESLMPGGPQGIGRPGMNMQRGMQRGMAQRPPMPPPPGMQKPMGMMPPRPDMAQTMGPENPGPFGGRPPMMPPQGLMDRMPPRPGMPPGGMMPPDRGGMPAEQQGPMVPNDLMRQRMLQNTNFRTGMDQGPQFQPPPMNPMGQDPRQQMMMYRQAMMGRGGF